MPTSLERNQFMSNFRKIIEAACNDCEVHAEGGITAHVLSETGHTDDFLSLAALCKGMCELDSDGIETVRHCPTLHPLIEVDEIRNL